MKIDISNVKNSGSKALQELGFHIGDEGVILEFLRTKLYSDPIGSICREILSNARDAHREKGNVDRPVKVVLPNTFDTALKIRDFGPGITPSRMNEVYRSYGNSTKRDSNLETGGFGLGAKTPFAYTPQFTVVSITDINTEKDYEAYIAATKANISKENIIGKRIKCIYIMHTSDDKKGSIKLLTTEITNEETGLEVIIDVKREDHNTFCRNVINYSFHWDVKPELYGNDNFSFEDKKENILMESENKCWELLERNYYNNTKHLAIIDGIPYPINVNDWKGFSINLFNLNFKLYFNTGELDLSISREQLYYTSKTKEVITKRIEKMLSELNQYAQKEIDKHQTYKEAFNKLEKLTKEINGIDADKIKWKGNVLTRKVWNKIISNKRNFRLMEYESRHYNDKIKYCYLHSINPNKTIIINDVNKFVPKHLIQTYFDKSGNIDAVVLTSKTNTIYDDIDAFKKEESVDIWQLDTVKLSSFKSSSKKKSIIKRKNIIDGYILNNGVFNPTEINYKTISGKFVIIDNRLNLIRFEPGGQDYDYHIAKNALKHVNIKVYGVTESKAKKLIENGWEPIKQHIVNIQNNIISQFGSNQELYDADRIVNYAKNSLFYNFKCLHKIITQEIEPYIKKEKAYNTYCDLLGLFNNKTIDYNNYKNSIAIKNIDNIGKKYPLLNHLDNYYYRNASIYKDVEEYVELMDKKHQKKGR